MPINELVDRLFVPLSLAIVLLLGTAAYLVRRSVKIDDWPVHSDADVRGKAAARAAVAEVVGAAHLTRPRYERRAIADPRGDTARRDRLNFACDVLRGGPRLRFRVGDASLCNRRSGTTEEKGEHTTQG